MQTNDALSNAFHLLALTVNEFQSISRPCLGATLKPRLFAKGFNDRLLGFSKFGDFLRAAEGAGVVKLSTTPGGDIQIGLPSPDKPQNTSPPPTQPSALRAQPVQVRQDLWTAFNSLSDTWCYDPVQDRAFKGFSGITQPGTIKIPSGAQGVKDWMRAFADLQSQDVRGQLLAVVDNEGALYQFNSLARQHGLQRDWSRFHITKVIDAIEAWARSANVSPKGVASPYQKLPRPVRTFMPLSTSLPEVPSREPLVARELNSRLESLIDSTINELIMLRGLLQLTGPKEK
jgi:hypothetical protein